MSHRRTDRRDDRVAASAVYMAEQLCRGFKAHDDRERERSVEAFFEVDRRQFALSDETATRRAARAYVDALWAKDAIEEANLTEAGAIDQEAIGRADWGTVEEALAARAAAVGIDREYARATTTAWRRHKAGGDYWTPTLRAQACELRGALGDRTYPRKPSEGHSGYGPEAARYVLAIELHDMHTEAHWREAVSVMQPYFERILRSKPAERTASTPVE